jgi:small subunit ribosomal protein S17
MPKRVLTGTVVSDKGDKTIVVRVERRVKHPLYGKIIRLSKKYHAHDEANAYRQGEQVRIEECAPVSKLKTWTVLERVSAARAEAIDIDGGASAEPARARGVTPGTAKADAKVGADQSATADA